MGGRGFDELAKEIVARSDRRRVAAALLAGLGAPLASRSEASARHKAKHCAKEGQKAHPHKPCCAGAPGPDGRCTAAGTCLTDGGGDEPSSCECRRVADGTPCEPVEPCEATQGDDCAAPGAPCRCAD